MMRIFTDFDNDLGSSIVTIGSFDGVHKGHQMLIDELNKRGDKMGLEPIVVTFDPHPRSVLKGNNRLLSTLDEKLILLEKAGARNVFVINFTAQFAQTTAQQFIEDYIVAKLQAKAIIMGEGHFFGKDKGGSAAILANYELAVFHIDRLEKISSTDIRGAIENGDIGGATRLLNGPYLVATPIKNSEKLLPHNGSYQCLDQDGKCRVLSVEEIKKIDKTGFLMLKK